MKKKLKLLLVIVAFLSFLTTNAQVNMNRYITLNVIKGDSIQIDIFGDTSNTDIKIVSGSRIIDKKINSSWTNFFYVYSTDTIITIYGNIKRFDCSDNRNKILGLNASNNIGLVSLLCFNNHISNLDLIGLTSLEYLDFNSNQLSGINLVGLNSLTSMHCYSNQLTELNLSDLNSLSELYCHNNYISTLSLIGLPSLTFLSCNSNKIDKIKINDCINLRTIYCEKNNLSACGLDSLFSQLPYCTDIDMGIVRIKFDDEINPGWEFCRDTIATNRRWKVRDNTSEIANDVYSCDYFTIGIKDVENNLDTRIYPNPVDEMLIIDFPQTIERIEVYDVLGRQILKTNKNNSGEKVNLNCSNWEQGIYIIKIKTKDSIFQHKLLKK
ncbi:MAG: T9SS type A sorting domain-containing protein [Bacteroidales bacterium]|nr:T9SS type A sorting domain-containing protein [Bacteroidales bacterium]